MCSDTVTYLDTLFTNLSRYVTVIIQTYLQLYFLCGVSCNWGYMSGNGVTLGVEEGRGHVLPDGHDETWVEEINRILEVLIIHGRKSQKVISNITNECVVQFLLVCIRRCVFILRLGV